MVSIKYLTFVVRAHNQGEGGAFALLALLPEREHERGRLAAIAMLGVVSAALLYGDGIVTPAISVLSAVEGLELAAPRLAHAVLPITCVTLLAVRNPEPRHRAHRQAVRADHGALVRHHPRGRSSRSLPSRRWSHRRR